MSYITENDLIKAKLAAESPFNLGIILKDIIQNHDPSKLTEGVNYYYNHSDILNKQRTYYDSKSNLVVDHTKANNRIVNNWHKLLVDQKTAYSVGKPLTISHTDEKVTYSINNILNDEFDDMMNDLYVNISNKGIEWVHVYINEYGEFDYMIMDAEGIIPIWDSSKQKKLDAVIRYYYVKDSSDRDIIRAEYWDKYKVHYFLENSAGNLVPERTLDEETLVEKNMEEYHYYIGNEGYGWGRVPFIPFKNNEKMVSDLVFYKSLVDSYDSNMSNLADNLDDIQEVVYILRGYAGEDLKEFNDNLRYWKSIKVDEDGGVDKLELSIPIEARKELLDRLEHNIFVFGQGVNVKSESLGNQSGVALKFLYTLLDMKVNKTERKVKNALRELLWFLCEYFKLSPDYNFDNINYKDIEISFNHSMISNETEIINMLNQSSDLLSEETRLSNHPLVDDINVELERKAREEKAKEEKLEYDFSLFKNNQLEIEDNTNGEE